MENAEHALVRRWLPPHATVLELGGRFGTTTCEIAKVILNSGRVAVVEPETKAWPSLKQNLQAHHCKAHILHGVVGSVPMSAGSGGYGGRTAPIEKREQGKPNGRPNNVLFVDVEEALGSPIDTLLIDCEGCAQHLLDQIGPPIRSGQIKLILLEADMPTNQFLRERGKSTEGNDCRKGCMDYGAFFDVLMGSGFELVDEYNDCDLGRTGNTQGDWCGPWIWHYAWARGATQDDPHMPAPPVVTRPCYW
jgi:FkbM family methyltransferase